MTAYNDYTPARIGFLFGLSLPQLVVVAVSGLPLMSALGRGAWVALAMLVPLWVMVVVLTVVPVRGRSAVGWLGASILYLVAAGTGRSQFRGTVAKGEAAALDKPDLPGALNSIEIHEGAPTGPRQDRYALIQNHATATWAMTAAVVHPGTGLIGADERELMGQGLTELINGCSRTELIDEILLYVRTVPDDGAERAQWLASRQRQDAPAISRQINQDLQEILSTVSVRTECYVTFVVPESRLARHAKEAGGGLQGRANILYTLAHEVEAHLSGGVRMASVRWLTSPDLAAAVRTGFAPGDRAGIVEAVAAADHQPGVAASVPWALAGPSGADPAVRHYSHDAWNSVSATVRLPSNGVVLGAWAPILRPAKPGERRSCVMAFPVMTQSQATTKVSNKGMLADMADGLRERAQIQQRSRDKAEADKTRRLESKVGVSGQALCEPYAVVTVTVPKTQRVAEFGQYLDSSIRGAGFQPLRLDLAQDVAFAASTVPLGVSLARGMKR